LSRLEQGNMPDLETFARLCAWLRVSANEFVKAEKAGRKTPTPELLEAHLRADRVLPPKAIDGLAEMIRLAYQAAKHGHFGKTTKG
jgi:transcriptional regulator with XRE-family HTH domain